MLASISSEKFYEWKAFYDLEPDGDDRNDWGLAHIVQAIIRDGKPLQEFMIPFGDTPAPEPVKQSLEFQQRAIDSWISGSNKIFEERARRNT